MSPGSHTIAEPVLLAPPLPSPPVPVPSSPPSRLPAPPLPSAPTPRGRSPTDLLPVPEAHVDRASREQQRRPEQQHRALHRRPPSWPLGSASTPRFTSASVRDPDAGVEPLDLPLSSPRSKPSWPRESRKNDLPPSPDPPRFRIGDLRLPPRPPPHPAGAPDLPPPRRISPAFCPLAPRTRRKSPSIFSHPHPLPAAPPVGRGSPPGAWVGKPGSFIPDPSRTGRRRPRAASRRPPPPRTCSPVAAPPIPGQTSCMPLSVIALEATLSDILDANSTPLESRSPPTHSPSYVTKFDAFQVSWFATNTARRPRSTIRPPAECQGAVAGADQRARRSSSTPRTAIVVLHRRQERPHRAALPALFRPQGPPSAQAADPVGRARHVPRVDPFLQASPLAPVAASRRPWSRSSPPPTPPCRSSPRIRPSKDFDTISAKKALDRRVQRPAKDRVQRARGHAAHQNTSRDAARQLRRPASSRTTRIPALPRSPIPKRRPGEDRQP